MLRRLFSLLLLVPALLLIVMNARLYLDPFDDNRADLANSDLTAQLRFLSGAIDGDAGEQMQGTFPEGFLFLHALYGLAWAELGQSVAVGSPLYQEALRESRRAFEAIDSPTGRSTFPFDLTPRYGIFYAGWRNRLQGSILSLQPAKIRDSVEVIRFTGDCLLLASAFESASTPFLQSYHGSAWPSDALVGVASLALHDRLFTPIFQPTIARWKKKALERLDSATGLLPHAVDGATGFPLEGARGSSQALMLRFLYEVDSSLARQQYAIYRKTFVTSWLGLPALREYPHGADGDGDIDSGPVLFGVGASASIVGMGTARAFGDDELARPLGQSIEMLGMPFCWEGRKFYLLGNLPIADAFLVWSKSAGIGRERQEYGEAVHWWWRVPIHLLSMVVVALLIRPLVSRRDRRLTPTVVQEPATHDNGQGPLHGESSQEER